MTTTIHNPQRQEDTRIRNLAATLLGCAGVGGYALWLASGVLVKDGNWVGVDFHVYYQAARAFSRGQDIYSAGISPPYVYPPLLAILVLPLATLPVSAATIAWKLLQHVCLLAAGALLINLVPKGARPLAAGLLLFGWLLVPVQDEILVGESNSLVLLLVAGGLWLTARGVSREKWPAAPGAIPGSGSGDTLMTAAGMLLGMAAGIKVLPLMLVAYFWWRGPRRVAAWATAGFVALQLACLVATPSTARYWLVEFPSLFGQAFPFLDNQSLNAAISRAFLSTDPSLPNMQIAAGDTLRSLLTWLANLVLLSLLIVVLRPLPPPVEARGKEPSGAMLLLEAGLVLLTVHLVSGSTWLHHLVDLAVPVCGLVGIWWLGKWHGGQKEGGGNNRAPSGAAIWTAVGVAFILLLRRPADWLSLSGALAASSPPAALAVSNSGLWALLLLWVAAALSARRLYPLYQSSRRAALAAK